MFFKNTDIVTLSFAHMLRVPARLTHHPAWCPWHRLTPSCPNHERLLCGTAGLCLDHHCPAPWCSCMCWLAASHGLFHHHTLQQHSLAVPGGIDTACLTIRYAHLWHSCLKMMAEQGTLAMTASVVPGSNLQHTQASSGVLSFHSKLQARVASHTNQPSAAAIRHQLARGQDTCNMAMQTQLQIRQNAQEVQEYLSELHAWQKNMKQKQSGSSSAASSTAGGAARGNGVPGPRGRASSAAVGPAPAELQAPALSQNRNAAGAATAMTQHSAPAATQKASRAANKGTAASHTYSSYAKWDKLNMDAMLASDSDGEDASSKPPQHSLRQQQQLTQQPAAAAAGGARVAASQPGIQLLPQQADKSAADLLPVHTTRNTAAAISSVQQGGVQQQQQRPPVRNSEPQTAEGWRTRGNDLFKAGQYAYAKDCYTRSIQLDASSAAAYANRALVELRLGQLAEADDDCTQALALDPLYIKAYHRRGTARKQLGQLLAACQDFEDAYRLEPVNKALQVERDAALAAHMSNARIPDLTHRTPVSCKLGTVQTSTQPTASPASLGVAQPTHSSAHGAAQPQMPQQRVQQQAAAAHQAAHNGPAQLAASSRPAVQAPSNAETATAASPGRVSVPGSLPSDASGRLSSSGDGLSVGDHKARLAAAAAAAAQQLSARMVEQVRAPRTSTEFEATWRSLSGDAASQLSYLHLLPPSQLPSVFKASLTPQLLASILKVLLGGMCTPQHQDAGSMPATVWSEAQAVEFLQGLCKVPRVEMAAMCIGSKQRQELQALWAAAFNEQTVTKGTAQTRAACKTALKL